VTELIEVSELAGSLDDVVVLDARYRLMGPPARDDYALGHIPGAVFIDMDTDMAAPPGSAGRHPMPAAGVFESAMRRAGVNSGSEVVVYDDADSVAAARAWWLLKYFGHDGVRVLNGGYRAWLASGGQVSAEIPAPAAGDFRGDPGHMPVLDADQAAALAKTGLLLDARATERYRGEVEPIDSKAGHIPGAISAPSVAHLNADGTFRTPAELAERFAALGVTTGVQTGTYCGSGVTAAHEALAMRLAGLPTAAVYVGSWSNWVADPARPIATTNR
jgi:thiosulfate/3-mercaptopyruvate sulfurtransferase